MTATTNQTRGISDAPFWRQADPVLGDDGRVSGGGMWEHQRAWWRLPNFIKALVAGYGGGKTNVGCKWAVAMALHNAPAPFAVVSPTFSMARETTITTLEELLAGKQSLLGSRFSWNHNKSDHVFHVRHGRRRGRILILSGDNPLRLKGPNLCGALIDEPFMQEHAVFEQMLARVRHPEARSRAIGLTGTPEQLNWGYDLIEGELSDTHDVGFVRAPTAANRALPGSYVETLTEAFDDKTAAAYLLGEFVNLAKGLVYHAFDPAHNVCDEDPPDGAEWGCGMDFNVDPMAFVVFWRTKKRIHVVEDFELPNSDTEYACAELGDRYPQVRDVYPDPSGKSRKTNAPGGRTDFDYIRQAGLRIHARAAAPARRDRYNAMNGALKKRGDARPILTIAPRCKRLKKAMLAYSHEKMNTPAQKALSHPLDATGYAVEWLFSVRERVTHQRAVH